VGDGPILRYKRQTSDFIGQSFSQILEATPLLHRFEMVVLKRYNRFIDVKMF
jgi:hypothetical protein